MLGTCGSTDVAGFSVGAPEVELLYHLVVLQGLTDGFGTLLTQLVLSERNFGQRGADGDGRSQRCRTLWANLVVVQIQLQTGERSG